MVRFDKNNEDSRMARYQKLRNNTDSRIVHHQETKNTGTNEFLIRDNIWYYEKRLSNVNVFYALSWFMNYITLAILIFDPTDTFKGSLIVGLFFAIVFLIRRDTLNKIEELEAKLQRHQNKF
ncbi:hypothetical protein DN398_24980 [Bacillus sp. JAS102]|uniref:hypothetical protein n=1 Tax=Bacillus sp. JAS102 TaxID=2217824 RepID=UPI0011F01139|nr:hypothetical protein [Bacillus sp. JAS102]KAA0796657.1 hypothetical protein DN398_24980 [Bacillus sp. JAS102]